MMDLEEIFKKYSPELTPEMAGEKYLGDCPIPYPQNPQRELDLHGFFVREALSESVFFLRQCRQEKLLKVRIITGHGRKSLAGFSILFLEIKQFLLQEKARGFLFSVEEGDGIFDILFLQ